MSACLIICIFAGVKIMIVGSHFQLPTVVLHIFCVFLSCILWFIFQAKYLKQSHRKFQGLREHFQD